jgi:SNF2 family DNA or RNA helicase
MEYKITPWDHQLRAIETASPAERLWFAFFFEMGAGKTMTVINTLRHKAVLMQRLLRTIVLTPPIVIPNWKDEFLAHSKIPEDRIILLDGSGEDRIELFKKNAWALDPVTNKFAPRPAFFITNYESLLLGGGYVGEGRKKRYEPGALFKLMTSWGPDAIIFDESHKIKNYKAERSKQAARLTIPERCKIKRKYFDVLEAKEKTVVEIDRTKRPLVYLLSGSPVLNSPEDIFWQYYVMDAGATFGANFFVFRATYFEDKNAGMLKNKEAAQRYFPKWELKPGALEKMNELIYKSGMRVTKEECLDLPEEVSVTIRCPMVPDQIRNYKEMKQDFITYINDTCATATLAIVKALRLMQITSGFLALNTTGEEGDVAKHVYKDTGKEKALKELLESLTPHHKVIVWAVWKENYNVIRRVCEELGVKYAEVHGQVSRAKQDAGVEAFKTDPNVRVFIGHPGSGGIGINLTCAPYSIFYSRTFSLEHWLQARARNHRGGQKERVTHYDLVCTSTIDEKVQEKLQKKFDMSEKVLSTLATELKYEKDLFD